MNLNLLIELLVIRLTNRSSAIRSAPVSPLRDIGFSIGTCVETGELVSIPLDAHQHLYVIGASGSGKTTFLRRLIEAEVNACR